MLIGLRLLFVSKGYIHTYTHNSLKTTLLHEQKNVEHSVRTGCLRRGTQRICFKAGCLRRGMHAEYFYRTGYQKNRFSTVEYDVAGLSV